MPTFFSSQSSGSEKEAKQRMKVEWDRMKSVQKAYFEEKAKP